MAAAECARRSPARAAPAGALAPRWARGAHGALRGSRGVARGDHAPGDRALPAQERPSRPANALPGGLAQPGPPAPGRCRSLEGASPAPGAPPPPAQRSRPQPGCHLPLAPGAEDREPPAASPLPKEPRTEGGRASSTSHTPLVPSGKGRGPWKPRGRRGEWPWSSGSVLVPLRA